MALIKTIAEVKAVLRISSLDEDMSLPDVDQAQAKHIVTAIGKEIVDELTAVYDAGTGTAIQKQLIAKIQKPLAAFAYLDDIGIIHATINDRGVSRISTAEMPAAYRWEFEEVKATLEDKALTGMEQLLEFLEENSSDFPTWANSKSYKDYFKFLISSGWEFTTLYNLHQPLRIFQALRPILQLVEDMYITPVTGENFLKELKIGTVTGSETDQLLTWLKKSEAYLCIKHAIEMLPVRISDRGFTIVDTQTVNPDGNRQPAKDNLLRIQNEAADRDGQNYLKKAKALLNQKASATLWPTYFGSEKYQDPANKKKWERGNEGSKMFRF